MGAARAAGRDAAAPGPPRRAYTAPMSRRNSNTSSISNTSNNGARPFSGAPDVGTSEAARAVAAAAAADAAAAAVDFGTSPKSEHPADAVTTHLPPTSANGEAVETLYSHPAAKILSFTAGGRNSALDSIGSTASRGRSRRSLTAGTEDDIEPGTLPWSSQFDRTIAVGALSIYRAPGSVAFLSCGSALQPILPKSQCWCIDEESSKFILQIRRPQYWRIEVPVGDDGENDERARRLREVLDHILQFEKTPCPFKRDFTVELPEQPSTPLKKKPWTPVKRPEGDAPAAVVPVAVPVATTASQPKQKARSPSPPSPTSSALQQEQASSPSSAPAPAPAQPGEFTRREWLAMLESQKKGAADEVDEFGRRLVPALVAEHEQRIMDLKASEIEINKMGSPWRNTPGSFSSLSGGQPGGSGTQRDRALSQASDNSALRSAWPAIDRRWLEESDRSTTADSSSPFNSLRSWLSASGNNKALVPSSPPSSTSGSLSSFPNGLDGAGIPPSLSSLYEDARRMFNNGGGNGATTTAVEQLPRIRHRATTSSISVSNHPSLPPAVNIIAPSHLRNLHSSGRATTRLQALRRIPGSIIYRVIEILLAPPSYLLALMLKIAARILSGEWRGFVMGKNTDTGENISVQWDYTDVDDPLGRSTELSRQDSVSRLNVYTEADVEVYTDAEDNDDDDDEDVTERCFSSSSSPKRSASSASRGAKSDAGNSDTLSDAGGDPIVWTRRWAVD